MLRSKLSYWIIAAAACVIGQGMLNPSYATIYENSIGGNLGVNTTTAQTIPNSTGTPSIIFESFTTGSLPAINKLADLQLELETSTATGSIVITLYPDAAGTGFTTPSAPGAKPISTLGVVTDASLLAAFGSGNFGILNLVNTQFANGASSLVKSSSYWIGIQTTGVTGLNSGKVKLDEATATNQGTEDQYLNGVLSNSPIGDMCTDSATTGTSCQSYVTGNLSSLPELTAQAPEPATLAVLGSALTGLGLIRRRRAKRAAEKV